MNSIFAILAAGALHVAALGPAALAALRPSFGPFAAGFYALSALIALTLHTGAFTGDQLTPYASDRAGRRPNAGDECAEILQLLEQARVILDRRDPSRLVVSQAAWDRLPGAIRDAATQCADRARPEGANIRPLEVVPQ